MSKTTNPITESSVSCGFHNSLNDRKYNSLQMSSLFDGIIRDGIFGSIGDCLVVTANSDYIVNVGTGKCWFNHTWTENDAVLPVDCGEPPIVETMKRIDAIVVEVNTNPDIRDNFIKVVNGNESSVPSKPTLQNDEFVHQHALCYITRTSGETEIVQANIEDARGVETPFVTGILEILDPDQLLLQWKDRLDRFVATEEADVDAELTRFISENEEDFDEWYSEMKTLMGNAVDEVDVWTDNQKATILDWFNGMKDQLSTDAATNLQLQINDGEIKSVLMNGFVDGEKSFSEDGTVITSTDSTGRQLVKTFTNEFLICTTVLYSSQGSELGRLVKNFSSDGRTVSSEVTII